MIEETKPAVEPTPETPGTQPATKKRPAWLPVLVLLVVFLAGFVPMWLKTNRLNSEVLSAQRQARVQQIQITFADAARDARGGNYEPARQGMAAFFSLVNAELARGLESALPAGASEELKPLLAQRDDLITLLARGDPASAERLAAAYADFRKTLAK